MKTISLVRHLNKQALSWTTSGIFLTASLSSSLAFILLFRDAEKELQTTSELLANSFRNEIFAGDIRGLELKLKRQLKIEKKDSLLFLDSQKKSWIRSPNYSNIAFCKKIVCKDFLHQKISIDYPIYFDHEKKNIWGYLHIDKTPQLNFSLIGLIVLTVLFGMLFQSFVFYVNFVKAIKLIGNTLTVWANHLSSNPKDVAHYKNIPFIEIEPVTHALKGLKNEIDLLENLAREQGSLETLRGIGHNILNPVARLKRIVGLLQMQSTNAPLDQINISRLQSNLKRLSSYAEQLKALYKNRVGENHNLPVSGLNISKELEQLMEDLKYDPDAQEKKIQLQSNIEENCFLRIPSATLGRIIENLVSNSISASSMYGLIKLNAYSDEQHIHISVIDNGKGIADEYKNKIFQSNFTTKENKGTGLGLFVVRQLCENYGGLIHFNSQLNYGTTFQISFPKMQGGI